MFNHILFLSSKSHFVMHGICLHSPYIAFVPFESWPCQLPQPLLVLIELNRHWNFLTHIIRRPLIHNTSHKKHLVIWRSPFGKVFMSQLQSVPSYFNHVKVIHPILLDYYNITHWMTKFTLLVPHYFGVKNMY
jgi:hypothetical protein